MKKDKVSATLYYVAAVLFNLAAIINFASSNSNSPGVVCLALGSLFLCLGCRYTRKSKMDNDN